MTLQALLEATDGHAPGYAGAARDCLLEVAEPETAEQWLKVGHVFAMLAVAEALNRVAENVDNVDLALRNGR